MLQRCRRRRRGARGARGRRMQVPGLKGRVFLKSGPLHGKLRTKSGSRVKHHCMICLYRHDEVQSMYVNDIDDRMRFPLISFDIEATESIDNSPGTWSIELRSANELKQPKDVRYRVTGLTLLPIILATEGLREVVAGILVMPLEAVMVRTIARAYRQSAKSSTSDLYQLIELIPASENLFSVFTLQLAITGVVWAGFTVASQWWGARKYSQAEKKWNTADNAE